MTVETRIPTGRRGFSFPDLWATQLVDGTPSRRLFSVVAVLCITLLGASVLGWDLGSTALDLTRNLAPDAGLPDVLHFLIELLSGLALVIAGLALFARSTLSREATIGALGVLLVTAGLLEILHGWTGSRGGTRIESPGVILSWTLARGWLALGLVVVPWWGRTSSVLGRRLLSSTIVFGAVAAAILILRFGQDPEAPDLLRTAWLVARPLDLVVAAMFFLALTSSLAQLDARAPSPVTHGLLVATVPWCCAQLEAALGWIRPWDAHFAMAHTQKLFGAAAVLAAVLVDGFVAHRRRLVTQERAQSTEVELGRRTAALEQADRELVEEAKRRRKVQADLRMIEKAVATMSLGVTLTDPEGRIIFVNRSEAAMHEYSVDELLGQQGSVFAPKGRERPSPQSMVAGWEPWTRETVNATRTGRTFPVRLVSDAVLDDNGKPLGLVTICEDITERREIEAALARRERVLRAIGFAAERLLAGESWEEDLGEVLGRLGEATGVDQVSLAMARDLAGTVPEQVWTGPWRTAAPAVLRPENLEGWRDEMEKGHVIQGTAEDLPESARAATPELASFVAVPILVDGAWGGVLALETNVLDRAWSTPEMTALEAAARTLGAAIQRRSAEAALQVSEVRLAQLLENASDLVQRVDGKGRITFVNRAWRETLGWTQAQAVELAPGDFVDPEDLATWSEALGGQRLTEGPIALALKSRQGESVLVEGGFTTEPEGKDVLAILRDVTERHRLARLKNEFVSIVSHELRTPLTSLIAALAILRDGDPASEDGQEMLEISHRNGERLLRLINDLLDLQKLSVGRLKLRLADVDVDELVRESCERIRSVAEGKEIRIFASGEAVVVRADGNRLTQVMDNLLSNAIKFAPRGSEVTVAWGREQGQIEIRVADRGPGIPEGFRETAFEAFSQVDGSVTRAAGGTGLGLSIVRGLVEAMGGSVDFETSTSPDRSGTEFRVLLPPA